MDKPVEMMLSELGVDESHRRQGIGFSLVNTIKDLALERRCAGMWVPLEPCNEPAIRTYAKSGATTQSAHTFIMIMTWDFNEHNMQG
mmetsp:Transcript_2059/g.2906  ORF Transcript_2059/g.2906 Transcript_2059/m.2906 type:complete len:87 (+) Transcript_2059:21-281(+)